MTERIPIILDVDTGIDDAAAICLAVHSPNAELLSILTVAGNTIIENADAEYARCARHIGRHGHSGTGSVPPAGAGALYGQIRAWQRMARVVRNGTYRTGWAICGGPASIVYHAHTRTGGGDTGLPRTVEQSDHCPECRTRAAVHAEEGRHHGRCLWTLGNIKPGQYAEFYL